MKEEIKCSWYNASRIQREHEISHGHGNIGTKGYEDIGCYQCSGNNTNCRCFSLPLEINLESVLLSEAGEIQP